MSKSVPKSVSKCVGVSACVRVPGPKKKKAKCDFRNVRSVIELLEKKTAKCDL